MRRVVSGLWQTWLAFVPTVLLAAAGLWWLVGETNRAEADAVALAGLALGRGFDLPAPDGYLALDGEGEIRFLYPDPPVPSGVDAGLPEPVLELWKQAKADSGVVPRLLAMAVDEHPSVLTSLLLARLSDDRPETARWRRRWQEDEAVRAVLRPEIERIRNLVGFRWLGRSATGQFLFLNEEGELSWWARATVEEFAQGWASSLRATLPDYIEPSVVVADVPIVSHRDGESLGQVAGDGFTVELALVDPAALMASVRRRLWLPAGMVVAAFGVGLVGFLQSRRALRREFALGQAKSDFVSSVSHELRAPVASVRLLAERMADGKVGSPARQSEYARFIRNETRRLGALIENVLDVSRIEQGSKAYHFEESDLAALVRDAVEMMTPAAEEKGVGLVTEIAGADLAAKVDPVALRQALVNLVDNAIKQAPSGSSVTVLARADATVASLSVRDAGPGIATAEQKRIFDRFYRIGSEINRESRGVGIGLSLVRHTAEAHGGVIAVESTPGSGSTFTLEIPKNILPA